MNDEFSRALLAEGASSSIPDEDNWYGQFVGTWDFEWVDGKGTPEERHAKGEWIFSWIIEGQAIQDVFICPSRSERANQSYSDAAYGTTIRLYNPKTRLWEILYAQQGYPTHFVGHRDGEGNIVQTMVGHHDFQMIWTFSEICPDSFHWTNSMSVDGGKTWTLQGELYAKRKLNR